MFFYVLMQGAIWLGTQNDPQRLPARGDYQLTDIFACFHLRVDGEKMSKSRGNFVTGDQLLDETRLLGGSNPLLPGAAQPLGKAVQLRLRRPRGAQPVPGRTDQLRLRAADLRLPLQVRRPRA